MVWTRTLNIENIVATTVAKFRKKIAQNYYGSIWLFDELNKSGNLEVVDGGESFMEPLAYEASQGGWYSDYMTSTGPLTTLDTDIVVQIGAAYYPIQQLYAMVAFSGRELKLNRGASQVVSLVRGKIEQARLTLVNKTHEALYHYVSNGPTYLFEGNGSTNALITHDGSGVVGGIDASSYTWWKNVAVGDPTTDDYTSGTTLLDLMAECYRKIRLKGGNPKIVLMHSEVYARYESIASSTVAMPWAGKRTGDVAFADLTYKGLPIIYDNRIWAYLSDGTSSDERAVVAFLDTDYLRLKVISSANITLTKFVEPYNGDGQFAKFLWYGNLTCNKRNAQGGVFFKNAVTATA